MDTHDVRECVNVQREMFAKTRQIQHAQFLNNFFLRMNRKKMFWRKIVPEWNFFLRKRKGKSILRNTFSLVPKLQVFFIDGVRICYSFAQIQNWRAFQLRLHSKRGKIKSNFSVTNYRFVVSKKYCYFFCLYKLCGVFFGRFQLKFSDFSIKIQTFCISIFCFRCIIHE